MQKKEVIDKIIQELNFTENEDHIIICYNMIFPENKIYKSTIQYNDEIDYLNFVLDELPILNNENIKEIFQFLFEEEVEIEEENHEDEYTFDF